MHVTSRPLLFSLLLLLAACTADGSDATQQEADEEEWIQLFNGEDLEGWQIKFTGHEFGENYNNTFRVEDGLLKVSYDEWDEFDGEFGHIFYEEPFSYYRIRVEYRFVGEQVEGGEGWAFRNNGAMLHSQSPESMERDQEFPASIEYQLLGGDGEEERTTANLCTPGTHVIIDGELITQHCINSTSDTYHGDQWVTAEALVLGDSLVQHIMEGEVVLEYTQPQLDTDEDLDLEERLASEGYIALQAESHPTHFRRVEVLNLVGCTDPEATNYKAYYVRSDEASCVYE